MKLEELKRICEGATPGPWHIGHVSESTGHAMIDCRLYSHLAEVFPRRDQAFVATFNPALVSRLLDVVGAAREVRMLDWTTDEKAFQRLHQALSALALDREDKP